MSIWGSQRDGREDLIVMRNERGGMEHYSIYLQQTNGPVWRRASTYLYQQADWRTALSWIVSIEMGSGSHKKHVPGRRPSLCRECDRQMLVGVHLAGEEGRIPPEPRILSEA